MNNTKYTFIVPVYNVEKYLQRCLDSLIEQEYTNFEIICINDGSTDSSLKILRNYEAHHDKIKVISQKNAGLGSARNTGLKYVSGDYVWFIDSDDWIAKNSLSIIENYRIAHPDKNIFLIDAIRTDDDKYKKTFHALPSHLRNQALTTDQYICSLLLCESFPAATFRIYAANLIKQYSFSNGFYEDMPLVRLFKNNIDKIHIGYVGKALYYYYRPDSIITIIDERTLAMFKQYDLIYDSFKEDKQYRLLLSYLFYYWSTKIYKRASIHNNTELKKQIKNLFYARKKYLMPFYQVILSNKVIIRKKIRLILSYLRLKFA